MCLLQCLFGRLTLRSIINAGEGKRERTRTKGICSTSEIHDDSDHDDDVDEDSDHDDDSDHYDDDVDDDFFDNHLVNLQNR